MTRIQTIIVIVLLVCGVPEARAELEYKPGPYIAANIGPVWNQQTGFIDTSGNKYDFDFERGVFLSLAAGYRVRDWFRGELELGYRKSSMSSIVVNNVDQASDDGTYGAMSGMLNGWFDLSQWGDLHPYVGLGMGVAHTTVSDWNAPAVTVKDTQALLFAMQVGGGVAYRVSERVTLAVDYRWFWTGGHELDDFASREIDFSAHNVSFGARFGF